MKTEHGGVVCEKYHDSGHKFNKTPYIIHGIWRRVRISHMIELCWIGQKLSFENNTFFILKIGYVLNFWHFVKFTFESFVVNSPFSCLARIWVFHYLYLQNSIFLVIYWWCELIFINMVDWSPAIFSIVNIHLLCPHFNIKFFYPFVNFGLRIALSSSLITLFQC